MPAFMFKDGNAVNISTAMPVKTAPVYQGNAGERTVQSRGIGDTKGPSPFQQSGYSPVRVPMTAGPSADQLAACFDYLTRCDPRVVGQAILRSPFADNQTVIATARAMIASGSAVTRNEFLVHLLTAMRDYDVSDPPRAERVRNSTMFLCAIATRIMQTYANARSMPPGTFAPSGALGDEFTAICNVSPTERFWLRPQAEFAHTGPQIAAGTPVTILMPTNKVQGTGSSLRRLYLVRVVSTGAVGYAAFLASEVASCSAQLAAWRPGTPAQTATTQQANTPAPIGSTPAVMPPAVPPANTPFVNSTLPNVPAPPLNTSSLSVPSPTPTPAVVPPAPVQQTPAPGMSPMVRNGLIGAGVLAVVAIVAIVASD